MANVNNTMYPPQVPTFAKAFVYDQPAVIPCGVSPYNDAEDVRSVHVSVSYQVNNESALESQVGLYFTNLQRTKTGECYIQLPPGVLKDGKFNINQFYKVQLRFDSKNSAEEWNSYLAEGSDVVNAADVRNALLEYESQGYFSEWSTVCLLRPILRPTVTLTNFSDSGNPPAFNKGLIPISGKLQFFRTSDNLASTEETETLQRYRFVVYRKEDENKEDPVITTDYIYTGNNINPNDINYRLDVQGLPTSYGSDFTLTLEYITKNQYSNSQDFEFSIADFLDIPDFHPTITVTTDNDNGIAHIKVTNRETVFGTLYVRRASSLDDFRHWENIYIDHFAGPIDLDISDNTVGSLVWYQYSVQLENSKQALSQVFKPQDEDPLCFPEFHEAIFSRGDQQLKISYNYQISNLKPVVNRTKIDTLGGKYPKFAENAVMNYKQFSINGMISAESDPHQKFLKKSKYFGTDRQYNLYASYVEGEGIKSLARNDVQDYVHYTSAGNVDYVSTTMQDWMWERAFREEVTEWLNDGEPKLYRSMTEGNMAVMLTDISLTPNATLGRRLYTFSATVYEVADGNSINTLDELGIYPVHKPAETVYNSGGPTDDYSTKTQVGNLHNYIIPNNNSVFSVIYEDLQAKYGGILQNKQPGDITLRNVKIFYESEPHIYYINDNQSILEIVPDGMGGNNMSPTMDPNRLTTGYGLMLTTDASPSPTTILVPANGYYQVPASINVKQLSFLNVGDKVHFEYIMEFRERNDSSSTISGSSIDRRLLGQERNIFMPDQYLGESIRRKYRYVQTGHYYQIMPNWEGISIETVPFSVVSIKYNESGADASAEGYKDYVIGSTGMLRMLKGVPVLDMCFRGREMKEVGTERQKYLKQYECCFDPDSYTSIKEIRKPHRNTVYNINGKNKIYYVNSQWYDIEPFTLKDDSGVYPSNSEKIWLAKVPSEGLINYVGTVLQREY